MRYSKHLFYRTEDIMQKGYSIVSIIVLSTLLCACVPHTAKPYQLCAGFSPLQQRCNPYPSQQACQKALHACQTAPNQVKPWLCGRCIKKPAT